MNDYIKIMLDSCGELEISPKGKSMRPYLKEKRDKVIVIPCDKGVKKYDIVLYKMNGIYVLHRVVGTDKNRYIICGDNNSAHEYINKEKIIGVVSEIHRNNRVIYPDDKLSVLWIHLWYKLGLKRYVLRVKNLFSSNK